MTSEPITITPELLLRATQAVTDALDAGSMLQRFTDVVREIVPLHGGAMGVLTRGGSHYRLLGSVQDRPVALRDAPVPIEGTTVAHVLVTGEPYLSADLQSSPPRFRDEAWHRELGACCTALFPLGQPGRYRGAMRFWRCEPPAFGAEEFRILRQLCGPLHSAVQHLLDLEDLEWLARRERALREISDTVAALRDPRQVFESITTSLKSILPVDRAMVLDVHGDEFRPANLLASDPALDAPPHPFTWRASSMERVVVRREALLWQGAQEGSEPPANMIEGGIQSVLAAPILIRDRVHGVLTVASREPLAYNEQDLDLLARAAQQLGLSIEHARSAAEVQRLVARERDLQDLGNALTGQLDPREVFEAMVMALKRLTRFDWAMVFELEEGWLVPLATNAPPEARVALFQKQALTGTFAAEALRTGRHAVYHQGSREAGGASWVLEQGYGSVLIMPILLRGQTLGALSLVSRQTEAFPASEMELLERAVRQFGVAIQGARSFAEVQRLAQRERDLLDITNSLSQQRSPAELFSTMAAALQRLIEFDRTTLFEMEGEWLHPLATTAPLAERRDTILSYRWKESGGRVAIETGRPLRTGTEEMPDSVRKQRLLELGYRTIAYIPVPGRDRVLAMIVISSRNPAGLTANELALAERAAQQFGLALENVHTHAQNLRLAERERTLLELTNAMTLHRNPQEILQEILPALEELIHFERTDFAAVFEMEGASLHPVATNLRDLTEEDCWRPTPTDVPPISEMMESGETRRTSTSATWSPLVGRLHEMGYRTMVLVPLVVHSRRVGLFWLASPRADAFPGTDVDTLSRVAQQFGLALEAARGCAEIQGRERRLAQENRYLKEELSGTGVFAELVGASHGLARVRELVKKVANTDSVVLIQGESGTGKELVAEALHRLSSRAGQPFIRVNCAALPDALISSELFGHVKGAFTGAVAQRLGRFEVARGGTLLLDEIGELSGEVQAKLLRVLQSGEFERVGSSLTLKTDARVVASTNRDLEKAVGEGRFRADLFFRLNVFPVTIPPLRERREDIGVLIYYFLQQQARKMGKSITRIEPRSEAAMLAYDWPGNVRELQSVISRAVILSEGRELVVDLGSLPGAGRHVELGPGSLAPLEGTATFTEAERRAIVSALRRSGGRIAGTGGAAELLGLKRTTLHSKMRKLQIGKLEYLQ